MERPVCPAARAWIAAIAAIAAIAVGLACARAGSPAAAERTREPPPSRAAAARASDDPGARARRGQGRAGRPADPAGAEPCAACAGAECPDGESPRDCAAAAADAAGAAGAPAAGARRDGITLSRTTFAELPGWADDRHADAIAAFLRSCAALARLRDDAPVGSDGHGGRARQWRRACAAASRVPAGDHAAARRALEAELVPYAAAGARGREGLFTGYHVQAVRASRTRGGRYQHPIYARPRDLVMVDLGLHIPDARARRIWGRLDARGELVPYYTRREIRQGALAGRGLELLYADDAADVLFAHIQGSAKVTLDDGSTVWLGFAGKNGRPFRGVGGVLKRMGAFAPPRVGTMQDIRAWLAENPARFDEIVDQNAAFVFFRERATPGAVGSQMVVLTPERSLAVDRAFIALGTPIWVDTRAPLPGRPGTRPWRRLLVAQDTGGAILGPVRGDLYWGDDAAATDVAGRTGSRGRYWLLLPRGVAR
jgi:membrane-bound lytic murein transglycosylase A